MIKIVLVEDHNIVRDGIKSLLMQEKGFQVVDEAVNGEEAIEKLKTGLEASIVITDINMPGIDGLELTSQLAEQFPAIKVIILSMLDNEQYIQQAFINGANGFLLKSVGMRELIFAVKHVADGNRYICSDLSVRLLQRSVSTIKQRSDVREQVELSARETEVLKMVASGMTNNEIADKLFTSRRTVEGHRQKLLNKTGTKNTAALIHFAIQHEILS